MSTIMVFLSNISQLLNSLFNIIRERLRINEIKKQEEQNRQEKEEIEDLIKKGDIDAINKHLGYESLAINENDDSE